MNVYKTDDGDAVLSRDNYRKWGTRCLGCPERGSPREMVGRFSAAPEHKHGE